ncbi:MAG: hydrogenase formation protein HypD [candidate division WOR-3 bacterium]|jgi:hydrogenase expression/formation protein HypD
MKVGTAHREQVLLNEVNRLVERLSVSQPGIRLMEVCGTHTMAISSSGIRRAVDPRLKLLSGPGCPVCVTSDEEIDQAIGLAQVEGVTVLTFGDMMRVPGSIGSLADARAKGADVRVVYSPLDGLQFAVDEPDREFVFLGVGFETTAPTVAATVLFARKRRVRNFSVLPLFKLIPPALNFIAGSGQVNIDGFILPGHVSTIIGARPYQSLVNRYRRPCCITGFEPGDILEGIYILLRQLETGPALAIQYQRSVKPAGNVVARKLMARVFKRTDAVWRGIGLIAGSGLGFRPEFRGFDAWNRFGAELGRLRNGIKPKRLRSCRCGEVMLGLSTPPDCPLFSRRCTPEKPVGPCMVSSEGACAAYYKYER